MPKLVTKPSRKPTERLFALLRALACLSCLTVGLLGLTARAVYADLEHGVLRLGQKLVSELGPHIVGAPEAVSLNGQAMFLGAHSSSLSVHEVLDRFAANCTDPQRDVASLLATQLVPEVSADERKWTRLVNKLRVLRSENESEGVLSCVAPNPRRQGLTDMVEGVRAFASSGDLSELGDLRYVTARKLPAGGTQVVAVWTEGAFLLSALLPDAGDAPGSDLPGVPRPPHATRSLSVTAARGSYGLRLYESSASSEELLAFYARELTKAGFEPVESLPEQTEADDALAMRAYTRAGAALAIGLHRDESMKTQVSLIDLGQVGRSSVFADRAAE